MARRHADVDHHQVRGVLSDQRQQVGGVAGLSEDPETGAFQQAREPLAEQHVVVGKDDTCIAHDGHVSLLAGAGVPLSSWTRLSTSLGL
jgi:hypothetical protein